MPSLSKPVERVGVGVADAGRHDLDQHFALPSALRGRPRRSRAASWPRTLRRRGSSSVASPNRFGRAYAFKKRRIQPPTRALSFGASSEAMRRIRDRARRRSASRSAPWRKPARIPDGTGRRSPRGRSRRGRERREVGRRDDFGVGRLDDDLVLVRGGDRRSTSASSIHGSGATSRSGAAPRPSPCPTSRHWPPSACAIT